MVGKKEKPLHSLTAGAIAGAAEACVTILAMRFTIVHSNRFTAG